MGTDASYGNNGAFIIKKNNELWVIIASDGEGWEHVSVHITDEKKQHDRLPTWDEMCEVKNMFWDKSDCIVQYHPADTEYINVHKHTLHLWRPTNQVIPIPPKEMIG
jgi:hypothetical protein